MSLFVSDFEHHSSRSRNSWAEWLVSLLVIYLLPSPPPVFGSEWSEAFGPWSNNLCLFCVQWKWLPSDSIVYSFMTLWPYLGLEWWMSIMDQFCRPDECITVQQIVWHDLLIGRWIWSYFGGAVCMCSRTIFIIPLKKNKKNFFQFIPISFILKR